MEKINNKFKYLVDQKISPFLLELYGICYRMTVIYIVGTVSSLLIYLIAFLVKNSGFFNIDLSFLCLIFFLICFALFLILVIIVDSVIYWIRAGMLIDKLTNNEKVIRQILCTGICEKKSTALNLYLGNMTEDLYPCEMYATPFKLTYREVSEKRDNRKRKNIYFIMTAEKEVLFDQLFKLVPEKIFEICYLRFSRILKEIRPIEGYEYAEGVTGILDKINKIYP